MLEDSLGGAKGIEMFKFDINFGKKKKKHNDHHTSLDSKLQVDG